MEASFVMQESLYCPDPPPRVERGHSLEALMKRGDAPGDTADGE